MKKLAVLITMIGLSHKALADQVVHIIHHYPLRCDIINTCRIDLDPYDDAFTGVFYIVQQEYVNCRGRVLAQKPLYSKLSLEQAEKILLTDSRCF